MAVICLSIFSTYYIYRSIGYNHAFAISKAAALSSAMTCNALPLVRQVLGWSRVAASTGTAPQESSREPRCRQMTHCLTFYSFLCLKRRINRKAFPKSAELTDVNGYCLSVHVSYFGGTRFKSRSRYCSSSSTSSLMPI
jgi:hypothetical protein